MVDGSVYVYVGESKRAKRNAVEKAEEKNNVENWFFGWNM